MLVYQKRAADRAHFPRPRDMPGLLHALLIQRGIASEGEAQAFLNPGEGMLNDPMLLSSMPEAVARIRRAVDALLLFDDPDGALKELHTSLLDGASWHKPDHYFVLKDFMPYQDARLRAMEAYKDRRFFAMMCLKNIAGAGKFSSDRSVEEYAKNIWRV